ncbi:MAG: AAA family ATPase, partial [Spirochaetaceae bacterium]|nr:AAA family ATPase [Spirochaetaceae bacterium]
MNDQPLKPEAELGEDFSDNGIRPRLLRDFQGQAELKDNLSVFITAARNRNEPLDHVFISGPPGLGKTTLANIMANELHSDIKVTSAPALDKPKDLAGLLSTIPERTVFFIDEIHRLKPAIEEMLYIAME